MSRTVSVEPATTRILLGAGGISPGRVAPMDHPPGESLSTRTESRAVCRWRPSMLVASPTEPGDPSGSGECTPAGDRCASARVRALSRRARSASAASVRRRISAYRTAYARVRLSTCSSAATSPLSESRIARNRDASIDALSSSALGSELALVRVPPRAASSVASDDARETSGNATTSTESRCMVESSTTTTSPEREQASADGERSSTAASRRATRGRI